MFEMAADLPYPEVVEMVTELVEARGFTMLKGWVYILECSDGSYYTGSTNNMERRLAQHQSGEGAKYTRNRRPVKLVYCEYFERMDDAFYREKQVQGWSRAKKKALIDGRFDDLPKLSASTISTSSGQHSSVTKVPHVMVPDSGTSVPEPVEGKGGNAAKQAMLEIEKQTGESIVSSDNAKALGHEADD